MAFKHIHPTDENRLLEERRFITNRGMENIVTFTVRLPESLHHKLKQASLDTGKKQKDLLIEAVMDLVNQKYKH